MHKDGKCADFFFMPPYAHLGLQGRDQGEGFIWVHYVKVTFFSVWLAPFTFRNSFGALENKIRNTKGRFRLQETLMQDLKRGVAQADSPGTQTFGMAAKTKLIVLNIGNTPTF